MHRNGRVIQGNMDGAYTASAITTTMHASYLLGYKMVESKWLKKPLSQRNNEKEAVLAI